MKTINRSTQPVLCLLISLASCLLVALAAEGTEQRAAVLHRTIDLNQGESKTVTLVDGTTATVRLMDVVELRDSVRGAVREARVRIEVNGHITTLVAGNYRLPVAGQSIQVDCPVTKGLYRDIAAREDAWGLEGDARLRIWPAQSAWLPPGQFLYPVKQRWFCGATQMSNEPSYVDGGDAPTGDSVYYHYGLDIGGCEGTHSTRRPGDVQGQIVRHNSVR